ncbi:MAG: hypothetical protein NC902_07450, partial [Candidatus Omnitrophica bacterium]|nr:hypothetical protein [Candidatus Omnitrophota bacterium]
MRGEPAKSCTAHFCFLIRQDLNGLKGRIKNLTDKKREINLEVSEKKLGVLERISFQLLPEKEKSLDINVIFPDAIQYKLFTTINEQGKTIYSASFPVNVTYTPISLELLKPIYRNSIYSTQKIDSLLLSIRLGLKEEEIKELKQEVLISDTDGRLIKKVVTEPKISQNLKIEIPDLKTGEYKITGRLTAKGKTMYEASIPLYKLLPAKSNEVYIDENLNLIFNGKPMMPLIWWGGSPAEEIAKTKADGIAVVAGSRAGEFLDEAHKSNQLGVVGIFAGNDRKKYLEGKDLLTEEAITVITERINSIKDHPALLYYYLEDEPEDRNVGQKILKQTYELIKELDPYHPVLITNDSVNGVKTYIDCADMFFPDPYIHFLLDGSTKKPMSFIVLFLKEIRDAGKNKKFIGVTLQAFDYAKIYVLSPPYSTRDERGPSFIEERCMNYLAMVYGAKGFHYYVYGKRDPNHWAAVNIPDLRVGMPYLIKEKKSLEKVVLHGKDASEKIKFDDKRIEASAKILDGKFYLIAVNTAGEVVNPEIKVPENIKKLKVISEKRTIEPKNGKFQDRFDAYDVHLYTDNLSHNDAIY